MASARTRGRAAQPALPAQRRNGGARNGTLSAGTPTRPARIDVDDRADAEQLGQVLRDHGFDAEAYRSLFGKPHVIVYMHSRWRDDLFLIGLQVSVRVWLDEGLHVTRMVRIRFGDSEAVIPSPLPDPYATWA